MPLAKFHKGSVREFFALEISLTWLGVPVEWKALGRSNFAAKIADRGSAGDLRDVIVCRAGDDARIRQADLCYA